MYLRNVKINKRGNLMNNSKFSAFADFLGLCNCDITRKDCCNFTGLKHLAFTLAEMMVVMLILSIIMAAMAPVMTTRNKIDQSSPWQWASNGSDAYYALGDAQVAMLGQETAQNTDTSSRLVINAPDGKDHILFKSGDNVLGRIKFKNDGLLFGDLSSGDLVTNSVVIGRNTSIGGSNSTAIGTNSSATNTNTTAIGTGSAATNTDTTAIGSGSEASGSSSNAIGSSSTASGIQSNAIGYDANASNTAALAIGTSATASGSKATAVGYDAEASGDYSIAFGPSVKVAYPYSIAIGTSSEVTSSYSIAVGTGSTAENVSSTAMGYSANAIGSQSIALGAMSEASAYEATAIGYMANASESTSTAIGYNSAATAVASTAIGESAQALGLTSIAIGSGAKASASSNVAIGYHACTYATGSNVTCVGYNAGPASGSSLAGTSNMVYLGNSSSTVYIPGKLYVGSDLIVDGNAVLAAGSNSLAYLRTNAARGGGSKTGLWRLGNYGGYIKEINNVDYSSHDFLKGFPSVSSDRRLKYVGKESTSGLDKIRQLKVFNYTFKKDEKKTPHVGVIAQDLQKVFPDAVKKGVDGFLTIRFEDMFFAMINAIKELDTKYQAQEKRIDELEARIEKLEAQIK